MRKEARRIKKEKHTGLCLGNIGRIVDFTDSSLCAAFAEVETGRRGMGENMSANGFLGISNERQTRSRIGAHLQTHGVRVEPSPIFKHSQPLA
jgi:hypothetical protein